MPDQELERLYAVVEGRVQGVGFRYFTQERAVFLGLAGWVRNRWNGAVELVAEGPRENLEILLKAVQRGPRAGTTRQVSHRWEQSTGEFGGFRIRRTA